MGKCVATLATLSGTQHANDGRISAGNLSSGSEVPQCIASTDAGWGRRKAVDALCSSSAVTTAKQRSLTATLAGARMNWVRLVQFASFALISVPFLWPPPTAAAGTGTAKGAATLIATATIALVIAAGVLWPAASHRPYWAVAVLLLIVLSIVTYMFYDRAVSRYTCFYNDRRIVIGDRLTLQARMHSAVLRNPSCSELIAEFAGNVEDVWTLESRIHASTVLSSLYVSVVGVLASMIVAVTQLLGLFFDTQSHRRAA
jgi:hypothetical protein